MHGDGALSKLVVPDLNRQETWSYAMQLRHGGSVLCCARETACMASHVRDFELDAQSLLNPLPPANNLHGKSARGGMGCGVPKGLGG